MRSFKSFQHEEHEPTTWREKDLQERQVDTAFVLCEQGGKNLDPEHRMDLKRVEPSRLGVPSTFQVRVFFVVLSTIAPMLRWFEDLVIALLWLKRCAVLDGAESDCVNWNKSGFFETE
jgi:hypothetical protein